MANRIREIRKSRHVTLDELSEQTGVATSHLSRIETGDRGLTLEHAVRIARALGCEVMDLTDEFSGEDIEQSGKVALTRSRPIGDIQNLTIHAGMGNGGLQQVEGADSGFVPEQFVDGHWSFPDRVRERFSHIRETHAIPVVGDSMFPTLTDGSVVFVDTTHVVPSPPDLYAVDYGDGLMVKRIQLVPRTGKVRVISDNKDRYETYELDRADLHVFGRVVASFQWRS